VDGIDGGGEGERWKVKKKESDDDDGLFVCLFGPQVPFPFPFPPPPSPCLVWWLAALRCAALGWGGWTHVMQHRWK